MQRIMLLITENCNLNCTYCYEHKKNASNMSFEIAKKIIDEYLQDKNTDVPIIIELFGGEAFVNFSLMKEIDDYISSIYGDLNIIYETTTNGTLIHGEIKDWLKRRKDRFIISLSLDGTAPMHNQNRMFKNAVGSYNDIDIDFFLSTWPNCTAKMTVSEKTLPQLSEGVIYLEQLGFKCDATLAIGTDWHEHNIPILTRELNKLIKYYVENPNKKLCTMLNMDFRRIFTPYDENYRFCGAGLDMVCFDSKGKKYPCQGFAPVSIGEKSAEYENYNEENFKFNDKNLCKTCYWVHLCSNCYAANLQSTGNIQLVDTHLCQFYKLCILASAKIQFRRILMKKTLNHDDQLTLKAIKKIQDSMKL